MQAWDTANLAHCQDLTGHATHVVLTARVAHRGRDTLCPSQQLVLGMAEPARTPALGLTDVAWSRTPASGLTNVARSRTRGSTDVSDGSIGLADAPGGALRWTP
eukprot:CAMPEP_0170740478 /NCGR_PEP_ID=MMETSP0437-20130122/5705_1 /TAXON_ID=0 /ORGANISM="Sexangularia sp." /LENGTH=103 /DNA_ID=CAMNT_0011078981 /DNA_START=123 /DNA_END=432 /DNA_ORIENTATION=+